MQQNHALDLSAGRSYGRGMTFPIATTAAGTKRAVLAAPGLAAIDLDGTLLGPDLQISAENRRAVARLKAAGFEVVIASGRHRESVRPFAESLREVRWIVSTQGAEVGDVAGSTRLSRNFLTREQLAAVLALRPAGTPALFYSPDGILTDTDDCEELRFYRRLCGVPLHRRELAAIRTVPLFKTVWVMPDEMIGALVTDPRVRALDIQTVRSHTSLLEFMPVGVDKGSGLAALAEHLGLGAKGSVVFGDAENDVPMFRWASWSYAMPQAWEAAKRCASQVVTDGPLETAVSRAVDDLLG